MVLLMFCSELLIVEKNILSKELHLFVILIFEALGSNYVKFAAFLTKTAG
jgi:hypothetical protein